MFDLNHLHPMIVHFPIALIVVGFMLELSYLKYKDQDCFSKAGLYLMLLGTLGAIGAYLSGEFFTKDLTGNAGEVQETHELFALITTITMTLASILRLYIVKKSNETATLKWLAFSLYAIGALMVTITGYFGGTLVYNYLIGI